MKRTNMYLLSTPTVKKKYDTFTIVMADERVYEFQLNEYRVVRDDDWIEVNKNDNTCMECFMISNIMRMKFMSSKAKFPNTEKTPGLTPVA